MKNIIFILLFLTSTHVFSGQVINKSEFPATVRIWQDGVIIDHFKLSPGETHSCPTYIRYWPLRKPLLFQVKYDEARDLVKYDPVQKPGNINNFVTFDGEYFNFFINDVVLDQLNTTLFFKLKLLGVDNTPKA